MKHVHRLPDHQDWGVDVDEVVCPFCESGAVRLESMTGGAANELLMRCMQCRSFFVTLKDVAFLSSRSEGRVTEPQAASGNA